MTLLGGLTGVVLGTVGLTCLALHLELLSPLGTTSQSHHIPPPPPLGVLQAVQVDLPFPSAHPAPPAPTRALPKLHQAHEPNMPLSDTSHFQPIGKPDVEVAN